jgi:hypothetical protein
MPWATDAATASSSITESLVIRGPFWDKNNGRQIAGGTPGTAFRSKLFWEDEEAIFGKTKEMRISLKGPEGEKIEMKLLFERSEEKERKLNQ